MAQPTSTPEQQAETLAGVTAALGRIPSGVFILTAQHEDRRMGLLVRSVQQVSQQPPIICVAVEKGQPIMPLISESHRFGLCQIGEADRILRRKFVAAQDPADDPFLGFELVNGELGNLPLLAQAMACLSCELSCHMDVEGDHDLFIGFVRAGQARTDAQAMVYYPAEA